MGEVPSTRQRERSTRIHLLYNKQKNPRMNIAVAFLVLACAWQQIDAATKYLQETPFDDPWTRSCGSGFIISRLTSIHDNHREDRRWSITRITPKFSLSAPKPFTDYVNEYDKELNFNCGTDEALVGIHSVHDNHREDRRFKFQCATIKKKSGQSIRCDPPQRANDWDDPLETTLPGSNYFFHGVKSVHSNSKEDRVWDFTRCRLR